MEIVSDYLNINYIFFTVLGYPMSYLEFFGTLLNLWSVYLVTQNNVLTWPVGNLAVILFGILFFQIQLYSDFIEQIYFLITGFYGWWVWLYLRRGKDLGKKDLSITSNTPQCNFVYFSIILVGTFLMGGLMARIHQYLPRIFAQPASYPYLDAFTTVMSFTATILMAHKKMESWYLWILVDIIGIWLYFKKSVVLISLLYLIFLLLSIKGLFNWKKFRAKEAVTG